jgi:hypothetical protein
LKSWLVTELSGARLVYPSGRLLLYPQRLNKGKVIFKTPNALAYQITLGNMVYGVGQLKAFHLSISDSVANQLLNQKNFFFEMISKKRIACKDSGGLHHKIFLRQ